MSDALWFGNMYERRTDLVTGAVEHRYHVFGRERALIDLVRRVEPGQVMTEAAEYQHVDHLGSLDAVTDDGGVVVQRVSFDAFGERRDPEWKSGPGGPFGPLASMGFTGQQEDHEIGVVDLHARLYDPALGRFLNVDPHVTNPLSAQSWNAYSYVRNQPTVLVDPTGMDYVPLQDASPMAIAAWSGLNTLLATVADGAGAVIDYVTGAGDVPAQDGSLEVAAGDGSAPVEEDQPKRKPTVPSRSDGVLDARYAAEGGIKDWIDIDPNAVDRRGRPIYACDSPTSCRSDLANYIELPVGTSDVEVYLAFGGMSKILGGVWKGLGGLLTVSATESTALAEAELAIQRGASMNSSSAAMGVERASPDLLESVQRHGRTIQYALEGSEEMRYLDYIGAEANVGGPNLTHILLRPNPSKAAVLEEFLHGTQARLGIIDRLGVAGAETHVKSFMIRHSQLLGLGEEDVAALRQLMEAGL